MKIKITCRFWIATSPCDGQRLSGLLSSITRGGSLGIEVYWSILSTDIILFSMLQRFHITHACNMFRLSPYVTANPATPANKEIEKRNRSSNFEHLQKLVLWKNTYWEDKQKLLTWINGPCRNWDQENQREGKCNRGQHIQAEA